MPCKYSYHELGHDFLSCGMSVCRGFRWPDPLGEQWRGGLLVIGVRETPAYITTKPFLAQLSGSVLGVAVDISAHQRLSGMEAE